MIEKLKRYMNLTTTENGGFANRTTLDPLVDFFSHAGAMRSRSEDDIVSLFDRSFKVEPLLTLRALFYFRDIRGGQGERRLFRVILKHVAQTQTVVLRKNLVHIPTFGRWDDMFVLIDTPLETDMLEIVKSQFMKDLFSVDQNKPVSLLGKWLKSENTSSQESRKIAKKVRVFLGLSSKEYRTRLVKLRQSINVVEQKMSAQKWNEIKYEIVPSRASLVYKAAFKRNDYERYSAFVQQVLNNETTINTGTLYPYEIVKQILYGAQKDLTLQALWNNLPNYVDSQENVIVVADVSGSMQGDPMAVSISLALYFAQRMNGPFKNHFITFSEMPAVQEVRGKTLFDQVRNLSRADWGMNTDIVRVFRSILDMALSENIDPREMVSKVIIVSDMEFDIADDRMKSETVFETIRREFKSHGFDLPELVFWNVSARNEQFPMTSLDNGVQLVSGLSPILFESILKGKRLSAREMVESVVDVDRYTVIRV